MTETMVIPAAAVWLAEKGWYGNTADSGWWARVLPERDWLNFTSPRITALGLSEAPWFVYPNNSLSSNLFRKLHDFPMLNFEPVSGLWLEWSLNNIDKRRAFQNDITPEHEWRLKTRFDLPENPSFCLSLWCAPLPRETDPQSALPTDVCIEFGGGQWRVTSDRKAKGEIWQPVWNEESYQYEWVSAATFHWEVSEREGFLTVTVKRNRLLLYANEEEPVEVWDAESLDPALADGNSVIVPAGVCEVFGYGGMVSFGWHELLAYNWDIRHTLYSDRPRKQDTFGDPDLSLWMGGPVGTGVSVQRLEENDDDTTEIELQVKSQNASVLPEKSPWPFPVCPEWYALDVSYPVWLTQPAANLTEAFPGMVEAIEITEPKDWGQTTAHVHLWLGSLAEAESVNADYRDRVFAIDLGGVEASGEVVLSRMFVGVCVSATPVQTNSDGATQVDIELRDITYRLETTEVDYTYKPVDGLTAKQCASYWLSKVGIAPVWLTGDWDALLDTGLPEDPLWQPRIGEKLHELMRRFCDTFGLALVGTRTGQVQLLPRESLDSDVSLTLEAATENIAHQLTQAQLVYRYDTGYTAAMVQYFDRLGEPKWIEWVDWDAEANPAYAHFTGYRKTRVNACPEVLDPATALRQVVQLFSDRQRLRREATVRVYGNLSAYRGQRVGFLGTDIGLDGQVMAVESVTFRWGASIGKVGTELQGVLL